MSTAIFTKYSEIAKAQFKLTLWANFLLALALVLGTPVLFGIQYLDSRASSFVLERFLSFTGIILCTPLFFPEQDNSVKELVESKYTPYTGVLLIRLMLALTVLLCLVSSFIGVMLLNHCQFAAGPFILGTFATALFLGSLGFLAYSLSDNLVTGYILPTVYYTLNMFSGQKLGNFYLFSLSKESMNEKYWLLGGAVVLFAVGTAYRAIVRKVR
ncbi:ABC transporter permease [Paenibacillus albidus]|uniref:ABC transporter permease n=1 Tax=Paenibacillus albidus TaxID=2041023 RepID=A0A917FBC2_9BACL|nr:hypothetical protein [Paenibacillus albidus]GGF59465.1 ABC transporter permease [Paenibacillus albidus]